MDGNLKPSKMTESDPRLTEGLRELEEAVRGMHRLAADRDLDRELHEIDEAIEDPDQVRRVLRTEEERKRAAQDLRKWAKLLEGAASGIVKSAASFETDPRDFGAPSGIAFGMTPLIQMLKDKASELRKDAFELEKL